MQFVRIRFLREQRRAVVILKREGDRFAVVLEVEHETVVLVRMRAVLARECVPLLLLEALARELQRACVFADDPHGLLARAAGQMYLDLERHGDFGTGLSGKMG